MLLTKAIQRCYGACSTRATAQPAKGKLHGRNVEQLCDDAVSKSKANTLVAYHLKEIVKGETPNTDKSLQHLVADHFSNSNGVKTLQMLQAHLPTPNKHFEAVLNEASLKSKLQQINLDPALAETYPDDLQFLFKTRIIYSIVGYQNNTQAGPLNHELKKGVDSNGNNCLLIKKEGMLVPVKDISKKFNWDDKEGMLASKDNPNMRWNYFKDGLSPIDRYYHHESAHEANYPHENALLRPVEQLSQDEMKKLLEHAKKFDGFNTTSHPLNENQPLDCIVQIVTHPRPMPKSWGVNKVLKGDLAKNMTGQFPIHCGIRLITKDGSVYSTGFGSTLKEDEWNEGTRNYLASINGQPTLMDYEEYRQHEGRIVTTIPLNQMRAEYILAHLNAYRSQTIRFNILKQNCMRLGTNILGMSGIHLNIRVALQKTLFRALPDLKQLPVIGKGLNAIAKLAKGSVKWIKAKTPKLILDIFEMLKNLILYVPRKAGALFKNILVLSLGGRVASPNRNQAQLECMNQYHEESLTNYNMLLNSLFDSEASDVHHSSPLVHWQLQQPSTFIHKYSGQPCMNLLPTESKEAIAYNDKKKAEFQDLYKYSAASPSEPTETKIKKKSMRWAVRQLAPGNIYQRFFRQGDALRSA